MTSHTSNKGGRLSWRDGMAYAVLISALTIGWLLMQAGRMWIELLT